MKSSARILFFAGILTALTLFAFFRATVTIVLLISFGIAAILDFVFMLESKTNKKLLWIHIIPLMGIVGVIIYYFFKSGLTVMLSSLYWLMIPIAANLLCFCALLVHIDNSIKQQQIKDLEAEISRLKG